MNPIQPIVKTRGGLLIALVFMGAIGFELRTVVGMFLGIDIPAEPYFVALLAIVSVFGVLADLSRTRAKASE
jgi:hypothetical protein